MASESADDQFYRDTESVAFPKLDDAQLSLLQPLGKCRVLRRGDLIYKVGQREMGLTVVLRGEIVAFESRDGIEQILATAGPRDFIGDVAMLQGTSALASARVHSEDAEVMQIPASQLQRAFAELPGRSNRPRKVVGYGDHKLLRGRAGRRRARQRKQIRFWRSARIIMAPCYERSPSRRLRKSRRSTS
jgi:hypothetical protein